MFPSIISSTGVFCQMGEGEGGWGGEFRGRGSEIAGRGGSIFVVANLEASCSI